MGFVVNGRACGAVCVFVNVNGQTIYVVQGGLLGSANCRRVSFWEAPARMAC